MAFTGLTLFTGAAGAALVSDAWPPWWGYRSVYWAIAALTILWIGVLMYLRFQLRRRRWAALRLAGCERVLAQWILFPPTEEQLTLIHRGEPPRRLTPLGWLWDWFCPQPAAKPVLQYPKSGDPPQYPAALVAEWVRREEAGKAGTEALYHERLVVLAGWVIYAAALLYTCWKAAP
jgi:hypothetical protein